MTIEVIKKKCRKTAEEVRTMLRLLDRRREQTDDPEEIDSIEYISANLSAALQSLLDAGFDPNPEKLWLPDYLK